MEYQDALANCRQLNCMEQDSAEYHEKLESLKDTFFGKMSIFEVDALKKKASNENFDIMAAQLLLNILGG